MSLPKILTVENDRVVINEVILSIPEFRELYKVYNKDVRPFQYLWAMYDPESPYMNYEEILEREERIQEDFAGDYTVNDYEMAKAIRRCEELYNSPVRKILRGTKIAIEKLSNYFERMEIDSGRDGNLSQVKSAIVDMPKIIRAFLEAENAYKQEVSRARGETRSGVDEDETPNWDD